MKRKNCGRGTSDNVRELHLPSASRALAWRIPPSPGTTAADILGVPTLALPPWGCAEWTGLAGSC